MTSRSVLREQAERVLALDAEATAGEWYVEHMPRYEESRVFASGMTRALLDGRMLMNERADAALIAEFRTLAPALAREVLRLTEALERIAEAADVGGRSDGMTAEGCFWLRDIARAALAAGSGDGE